MQRKPISGGGYGSQTEKKESTDTATHEELIYKILLYNDDVNTFEHVIECLQVICKHTSEQAEQCAQIVHFKGKCIVKTGALSAMKPLCEALLAEGLSAIVTQ